jgi:hypothetical protein
LPSVAPSLPLLPNGFYPTRLSFFVLASLLVFVSRQPWLNGFAPALTSSPPVISSRAPIFAAQEVFALAQFSANQHVGPQFSATQLSTIQVSTTQVSSAQVAITQDVATQVDVHFLA